MSEVKLCGMTRAEDVAAAVTLGAAFVGVIFAGGPRLRTVAEAIDTLAPARGRARTVGVFGPGSAESIAAIAHEVQLDVVQLHGDPAPADVDALRLHFGGAVWAVHRVRGGTLGPDAAPLFSVADGVVLDAHVEGALGGTGRSLPWAALAAEVRRMPPRVAQLVLAGGLRPGNVADAIALLAPDVVDVSSGVESAPGRKDHDQMRAFVLAAHSPAVAPRSMDTCRQ